MKLPSQNECATAAFAKGRYTLGENPKSDLRSKRLAATTSLRASSFGLPSDFGFRPSDFRLAFTLIEVLLAVAISAVVLAAINTVLFGAIKLRNKTAEMTEATLPTDRAVGILKSDLRSIMPFKTNSSILVGVMASDTTATGMSQPVTLEIFTANGVLTDETPFGDVQRIDYTLQDPTNKNSSTGKDLVRNVTRNLLAATPETPESQLLLSDVLKMQFSYYDGTNWNDSWSSTLSNTPTAVKLHIEFAIPRVGRQPDGPIDLLVPVVIGFGTNSTS